jgi:hypothetical protein
MDIMKMEVGGWEEAGKRKKEGLDIVVKKVRAAASQCSSLLPCPPPLWWL